MLINCDFWVSYFNCLVDVCVSNSDSFTKINWNSEFLDIVFIIGTSFRVSENFPERNKKHNL